MHFSIKWEPSIGPIISFQIKDSIYRLCFCHHLKERSISFLGLETVFCSRCLGLIFGFFFIGILSIVYQNFFRHNFILGIILIIPLIIDGFSQLFNWRESNNYLRLLTGFLFSIGLWLIIWSCY